MKTLFRKPGALTNSVVWHNAPQGIRNLYENHFAGENKEFVTLLIYAKEKGFSQTDIIEACKELAKRGVRKVSAEQLKAMLHGNTKQNQEVDNEPSFLPYRKKK